MKSSCGFVTHRWWALGVVREKDVAALNCAVADRLGAETDAVLGAACAVLSAPMRGAVFAQALEIMLCDGVLRPAEAAFAQALITKLGLSGEEAKRISDVIAVKIAY